MACSNRFKAKSALVIADVFYGLDRFTDLAIRRFFMPEYDTRNLG